MEVRSYGSWEEAQEAMAEAEKAADAMTADWQREISWGDAWCNPHVMYGTPIVILGKVKTIPETIASELFLAYEGTPQRDEAVAKGRRILMRIEEEVGPDTPNGMHIVYAAHGLGYEIEDEAMEEFVFTWEGVVERYNRGYRFGRAFSEVEPEGELGDTHISQLFPITHDNLDEGLTLIRTGSGDAGEFAQLDWFRDGLRKLIAHRESLDGA